MHKIINELQSLLACLRTLCPHKKKRKDTRDLKDMRATNYTYCISCFLILLLIKSRLGAFPLLTTCLL